MSESRLWRIFRSSWRYLVPSALLLGAAWVGKAYFLESRIPVEKKRAVSTDQLMNDAVAKLKDYVAAQQGKDRLPASAPWTPGSIDCAEAQSHDTVVWSHPTWKILDLNPKEPTAYQFRFRRTGEDSFVLLARTDSDCDGFYQVRRIRGETGWTGALSTLPITVDNPGE